METLREQLRRRRSEDSEHVILINDAKPGNNNEAIAVALNQEQNSRAKEMEAELKSLRDETRKLKEEKEDLQAQVINGGVIAGRNVLQSAASISIADELGSLSDNQVIFFFKFMFFSLYFFNLHTVIYLAMEKKIYFLCLCVNFPKTTFELKNKLVVRY